YDGKLYVADTYNSKIRVIDIDKETVTTLSGSGTGGYNDGDLADAQFFEPSGLTAAGGKLYVADANNHRIRVIDLAAGTVSTLVIKGLTAPDLANAGTTAAQTITLEPQTFGEGSGLLSVNIKLPSGYHFTPRAPSKLRWSVADDDILQSDDDSEIAADRFPIELRFSASTGKTSIDIFGDLYYCADSSSVCRYGQVSIRVPIQVIPEGPRQRSITIAHHPAD
ncbi:MAG: hypothetical protein D6800_01585, partial [Candidatus Zixiibacteriota bacterium]